MCSNLLHRRSKFIKNAFFDPCSLSNRDALTFHRSRTTGNNNCFLLVCKFNTWNSLCIVLCYEYHIVCNICSQRVRGSPVFEKTLGIQAHVSETHVRQVSWELTKGVTDGVDESRRSESFVSYRMCTWNITNLIGPSDVSHVSAWYTFLQS